MSRPAVGVVSAIPHTDTFNRANSAVSLGTSSDGLVWNAERGALGINGNAAYNLGAADSRSYLEMNDNSGTIVMTISAVQENYMSVLFRRTATDKAIAASLYKSGAFYYVYLEQFVSGSGFNIIFSTGITAPTVPFTLKVEFKGNTIKFYNPTTGALLGTFLDPNYTDGDRGTQVGIKLINGTTGRIDNFAVTAAPAAAVPATMSAPLVNTGFSAGSVLVGWTAPIDNFGPITGYTITPYIAGVAQSPTTVGSVLTTTITGLSVGTAYTFKIKATNSAGSGTDSAASASVTPINAYSIYPTITGAIQSGADTYAAARAGTGGAFTVIATPVSIFFEGQYFVAGSSTYHGGTGPDDASVFQAAFGFDTSAIVGTISSALLSLYMLADSSTQDFTTEARLHDFGSTYEGADYVPGASLSSKTLLATLASSGIGAAGYKQFTNVAMPANINRAGSTRIIVASDRTRLNTQPASTVGEFIQFEALAVDRQPKLVVAV